VWIAISWGSYDNQREQAPMLTREQIRTLALQAKDAKGLTWPQLGQKIGRSAVYTALLVYGYGQATEQEADGLIAALDLPKEAKAVMMKAPLRTPAQPWPPTDPFIYRFYEAVMLYGPAIKDVAHEIFGDGIMSAIDMSIEIQKGEDPTGADRMIITFNGKWLYYKKF
jgi:cyanate lyase